MAYRIESNKTPKEMMENLYDFLTTLSTIDDPDYSSSAGNGNLQNLSVDPTTMLSETWTLQCTDATAGTFSVTGSQSGAKADATLGTAYDNGIISFTLQQGSQPFIQGDIINITVFKNNTTPFTPVNFWKGGFYSYYKYGTDVNISGVAGKRLIKAPDGTHTAISSDGWALMDNFITGSYTTGDSNTYTTAIGNNNVITDSNFTVNFWIKNLVSGVIFAQPNGYNSTQYTGQYNKIGFRVTEDNIYLCRGANSFLSNYTTLVSGLRQKLIDLNINIADWMSFTFVIDRSLTQCKIYINDQLVYTITNSYFATGNQFFMDVLVSSQRSNNSDQYWGGTVWHRQLTDLEITQLYTQKTIEVANDYTYTVTYSHPNFPPTFLLKYKNNGYLLFDIQENQCFRARYYNNNTFNLDCTILNEDAVDYLRSTYTANNSKVSPSNFYALLPKMDNLIERYWFVSDGDVILLTWKIFDPTTTQTNPVYQTYYIGITEGIDWQKYVPDFYATRDGVDSWTTTSGAFRFGALYTQNYVRFNPAINRWVRSRTNTGSTTYPSNFAKLSFSENSIPLAKICARGEYYANQYYANDTNAHSYGAQYYETVLKYIYLVPPSTISPEDCIIIDNIKHIIVKDCNRSDSTSLFAIKLIP